MRNIFFLRIQLLIAAAVIVFSCKKRIVVNDAIQSNRPPIAIAGPDQTILLPINAANLDGSASHDPDNNIASYAWVKISGPSSFTITSPNIVQTAVTNLTEGIYQFELTVTDLGGLFGKDTMQVIVRPQPPPTCTVCKIVFVSARDGNNEIYSCSTDGSNIRRLTYDPIGDDQPAWSPDGSKIAFVRDSAGLDHSDLYVMNADGSNIIRRTFSGWVRNPTWSPDGTKIAYSGLGPGSLSIFVIGATSGSPSLLFDEPGKDESPAWSPDGSKIALVSDCRAYDFVNDIYTINADGSGFTALTGNVFDYLRPSWSPSGGKLAMAITETTGIQYITHVGVMNPDGSGITAIASGAAYKARTAWSADGTKIAYTSISGSSMNVSWVSADGSIGGTIVTNGWDADWKH